MAIMDANTPQNEKKNSSSDKLGIEFWICFITLFVFPLGGIMALISLIRKKKNDARLYGWSCLIGFIIFVAFMILK